MAKAQKATRKAAARKQVGPAGWIPAERCAPYSEAELTDLALMLKSTPSPRREQEALAHPIASKLLSEAASLESVMRPLIAVFGAEEERAAKTRAA